MLPATPAKLFQLETVRSGLPVLGRRVIAFLTVTALQRNDFSGHCSLSSVAAWRGHSCPRLFDSGNADKNVRATRLLNDLADRAGAYRVAAFTNRESQSL